MIQYVGGEDMINQNNIETLFDCFDSSATLLYKTYKTPYLDGLVITCENIMANTVEDKYEKIKSELEAALRTVESIAFDREEIRKAFQYACLRGFKHANISNQMMTPDAIGVLINYLVSKLYRLEHLTLLDPLVGTGNLICTLGNQQDKDVQLVGVDSDSMAYKLSSALFDMLGYGDQVYFQDSLSFTYPPTQGIITDFSGIESETCYQLLAHHAQNIVEGGFLVGVFDASTVAPEVLIEQSKTLSNLWKLFGILRLPDTVTKAKTKHIVIFQRNGEAVIQPEKILLVDLPGFTEKEEMKQVINQLNDWFKHTEFFKL